MIDIFATRSKIIDLALSGKISDQRRNEYVRFEHQRSKKWADVTDDEKHFEIPDNWKYVRVGEVTTINPKNDLDDTMEISFIPMACVKDGFSNSHTFEIKRWAQVKKGFSHLAEGDIGVAKITPCFQNRKSVVFKNLNNGYGAGTTELTIVRPTENIVCAEFLLYFFQSSFFINKGIESFTGVVGQQRIHKDYLKTSPLPLPPIQEQVRIVDKVNAAFELLDIIDELQYKYSCDVQVLKYKLIDAGIQGKLSEQFPEDGTAEDLYIKIQAEKGALIQEGKIKKEKALPEITENEMPFEIPTNWKWVRLGDISEKISSGNTPAGGNKSDAYVEKGYSFFREQNIYNDGIHEEGLVFIREELLKTRVNSTVLPRDILLNITGGSIGRCALIPDDFTRGSINQHILIIRMIDPRLRFYIHTCICSPFIQKYIKGNTVGDKDGFSAGRCKNMLIPLPPYAEQIRIVEKIREVISCGQIMHLK